MVALSVADEMDRWGHLGSSCRYKLSVSVCVFQRGAVVSSRLQIRFQAKGKRRTEKR